MKIALKILKYRCHWKFFEKWITQKTFQSESKTKQIKEKNLRGASAFFIWLSWYFSFQNIPKTAFLKFLRLPGLYYGSFLKCGTSMDHLISLDPNFSICKMGSWAPAVEGFSETMLLCCGGGSGCCCLMVPRNTEWMLTSTDLWHIPKQSFKGEKCLQSLVLYC